MSDTALDGDRDAAEIAAESDPRLEHTADGETYTIRRFRPGDRDGFLALHDAIDSLKLGGDEDWFAWKFEDPPHLAHVPIFVAERDGEVVGARPYLSFRLRAGPRTTVGLQTADTMVHPDHRSRGLFSRMNDLAFAFYRQREPTVLFSIPNDRSRPAYLDTGARIVSPIRNYLRIETPSRFVGEKLGWAPDRTEGVLDTVVGGLNGLADRRRNGIAPEDVSVRRHASVPVETMTALAARTVPDEIHVHRDRPFYEWRFENPVWTYDSYVAAKDGEPVAAMITGTRSIDGRVVTRLAEVVPLAGSERLPGVAAILERLLRTKPDTDVFAFSGTALPENLLRQFGFRPDDTLPLSPVASSTVLITMGLTDGGADDWTLENRDLTDPDNWLFPFCEHNTG